VTPGGSVYRDVPYVEHGLLVELDGRAFHDNAAARDRDAERDLDAHVTHRSTTVRLTYGQVFTQGCRTIRKVATLLERRGWTGPFRRCPDCP
jgi:very-short-patch-repair endonuclease